MAPSHPRPDNASSLRQNALTSPANHIASRTSTSKRPQSAKFKSNHKLHTPMPNVSGRILTDVLLSIKPVHIANIANRQKNHEYRKYQLRDGVTRLWFYETGDSGRGRASITHIAVIPRSIRHTPGSVPLEPHGIGNAEFNTGLKESKFGYPILELYELIHPITLAEMKSRWGMGGAPMGWRYVERDLWEEVWGEGRTENVKQVF